MASMMRSQPLTHSYPPATIPIRYPSPASPKTCSAEILDGNSDMPMNHQRRSRPARKYSLPVLLFLEARVATKKTSPRLTKIVTVSIHGSTMFHSSFMRKAPPLGGGGVALGAGVVLITTSSFWFPG